MASPATLPRRICSRLAERVHRACSVVRNLYQDSPFVFALILTILLLIVLIGSVFSMAISQYVGSHGAVIVDIYLFWLFARLVARALLFPGSVRLFQRNTEATFRTEMSRQYAHYLRQLLTFLRHAARSPDGAPLRGVSPDGVARGCAVIDTLTASLRMQKQEHEVQLSAEQAEVFRLAQGIEAWLKTASVARRVGDASADRRGAGSPILDWLQAQAAGGLPQQVESPVQALGSVDLTGNREEAMAAIDKLERLLSTLDDLRHAAKSFVSTVTRFLRTPTVGSLNQLRAELQMRYGGQRCWVSTRGRHKIDGMFIPGSTGRSSGATQEDECEDAPLKGSSTSRSSGFSGPTVIWCNPNAAYYETMVYQPQWLNFWLSHGINIFFFNYSGYGSSSGLPTPARIAEDGDAIVAFLKSKGISQIGVYGRSIGGVTACHIARNNPDVVQILIADRTMSQLQTAARYLYGAWAAKGLQFTRMVHSNVDNFLEVRCYKLLVVDPKDTMILDPAALRTAVALRVLERLKPEERFAPSDEALTSLAGVWRFFHVLFAICECDDEGLESALGHEPFAGAGVRREARQPVLLREEQRGASAGFGSGEGLTSGAAGSSSGSSSATARERVGARWLQENASLVRSTMSVFVDQLRAVLDVVGEHVEGGGTTLNDVFLESPNDIGALRCMLANIQVWGTLGCTSLDCQRTGEPRPLGEGSLNGAQEREDRNIEAFIRKDFGLHDTLPNRMEAAPRHLREIGRSLAPEALCGYHRRLARLHVALARTEFRRRFSALQSAFAAAAVAADDVGEAERLLNTVQSMLSEVEGFVSSIGRYFKSVDLVAFGRKSDLNSQAAVAAGGYAGVSSHQSLDGGNAWSESCEEKPTEGAAELPVSSPPAPQPAIDHTMAGYIMHIDCGHNGIMDEVDLRQLALHLRAARFGRTPPEYC